MTAHREWTRFANDTGRNRIQAELPPEHCKSTCKTYGNLTLPFPPKPLSLQITSHAPQADRLQKVQGAWLVVASRPSANCAAEAYGYAYAYAP